MKQILAVIAMLAIVAGISFADIGGSTATAIIGNADEQRVEVDQEFDIDVDALHFDVNGGCDYTFHDKKRAWDWLVGASYSFSIFKVGGSLEGNKDVKLTVIKAYADITMGDVGADIDFKFSADPAADPFQGAEFSAYWNPGPVEIRVGYNWTELGEPDVNVPEALTDGGLYAKAKISY
jgi:hypothetical protein